MTRSDEPETHAPPRGARRVTQDPWETVVREELRRLRRRAAPAARMSDAASRSAHHREEADTSGPRPSENVGDGGANV